MTDKKLDKSMTTKELDKSISQQSIVFGAMMRLVKRISELPPDMDTLGLVHSLEDLIRKKEVQ